MLQISDTLYFYQDNERSHLKDEVRHFLKSKKITFQHGLRIVGYSALQHQFDFGISLPAGKNLVRIMSRTDSKTINSLIFSSEDIHKIAHPEKVFALYNDKEISLSTLKENALIKYGIAPIRWGDLNSVNLMVGVSA